MLFQKKVYFTALFWAVISGIAGTVVYINLHKLIELDRKANNSEAIVQGFSNLLTITVDMETGVRGYLLSADDAYMEPFNNAEGKFGDEAKQLATILEPGSADAQTLEKVNTIQKEWIEGPVMDMMLARKKLTRGMIDQQAFLTVFKESKGKVLTDQIRKFAEDAIARNKKEEEAINVELQAANKIAQLSIGIGIVGSIILGFAALVFIVRRATKKVHDVVQSVEGVVSEITAATKHLSNTSSTLHESTEKLDSSVQQTSSAVDQIHAMMTKSSDDANTSQMLLARCHEAAIRGRKCVEEIKSFAGRIETQTRELDKMMNENNANITEMGHLATAIGDKTKFINDIVLQTRLLSFNASVEASRAGEHGKGFGVVAEEIGKLAIVTGKAAGEITEILTKNTSKIEEIMSSGLSKSDKVVKEFDSLMRENSSLSEQSLTVLDDIVSAVEALTENMQAIILSFEKEAKGLGEIKDSIVTIERFAQSNSITAKESSDLSENLEKQVVTLENDVEQLNFVFKGQQKQIKEL